MILAAKRRFGGIGGSVVDYRASADTFDLTFQTNNTSRPPEQSITSTGARQILIRLVTNSAAALQRPSTQPGRLWNNTTFTGLQRLRRHQKRRVIFWLM
jgi:hypothetical protein